MPLHRKDRPLGAELAGHARRISMAKDEKSICSEVQGVPIELASNPGLSVRVLAVDDEHSARKLLSVILGQSGFGCTTVNGGQEALEYLQTDRFDPSISDLPIPGMTA